MNYESPRSRVIGLKLENSFLASQTDLEGTANESVFKIDKFLGLNENPDGDTKLRMGEASAIRNWKVTRDRNLKRRPGFHTVATLDSGENPSPVVAMWFGNVNGYEMGLAACNGKIIKFYANGGYLTTPVELGSLNTTKTVSFFPFSNIVYILNGYDYYNYGRIDVTEPVAHYYD